MQRKHPPRSWSWLLERVLPHEHREFVLGDLEEEYRLRARDDSSRGSAPATDRGRLNAAAWYRRQAMAAIVRLGFRRPSLRRPSRGGSMTGVVVDDLRHGLKSLLRAPGFSAFTIIVLAAGIGLNAAVFTWIKGVVLEPFPGARRPSELVVLGNQNRDGSGCCSGTSYLNLEDYRARTKTLAGIAGYEIASVHLSGAGGAPERVGGTIVTGNIFEVMGVTPVAGRGFLPEETREPGSHPVIVISHALWQRRFGGDPSIAGRQVTVNDRPFTIVGVAPRGFGGPMAGLAFDVYVPVAMQAAVVSGQQLLANRGAQWLDLIARRRPGVTLDVVRAEMNAISEQIEREHPGLYENRTLGVYPLSQSPIGLAGAVFPVLVVLMAIVTIVLLVACANVAGLLIARASARRREVAVRMALGAPRARLVGQLLVESLALALAGAAAGLGLASWASRALLAFTPATDLPLAINLSLDRTVVAFTAAVAIVSSVLFGLFPALQSSRVEVLPALRGQLQSLSRLGMRRALIVGQVALSVVALVAAGLFARSLAQASRVDPGFDPRGTVLFSLDLFPGGYDAERGRQFFTTLLDRVRELPGVDAVTLARRPPLLPRGARGTEVAEIEGYQPSPGERLGLLYDVVGSDYFRTLRIPIVSGRGIDRRDSPTSPPVVVVNEAMARRYWQDGQAVGRRIRIGSRWVEVVGVAADTKRRGLSEAPAPFIYAPVQQRYEPDTTLMVRAAGPGDPGRIVEPVRGIVSSIDPALPLFSITTLETLVRGASAAERAAATGAGLFGLLSVMLAALGLYGIVSCWVSQRRREFGVRLALGATPGAIAGLVLRQAAWLAGAGVAVGLGLAALLSRAVAGLLFGVSPLDPVSFAATGLLLASVTLAATWLPARRAARMDPVITLRTE